MYFLYEQGAKQNPFLRFICIAGVVWFESWNSILTHTILKLFLFVIKGATKLYIMNYSRVVIILFSTGLAQYKSAFSTYSFGKTRFLYFYVTVFHVSVCLCFCCCIFAVLHSMNSSFFWIQCHNRLNNIV